MPNRFPIAPFPLFLGFLMAGAACNFPAPSTPAAGSASEAVQTVEAILTQTGLEALLPTEGPATEDAPLQQLVTEAIHPQDENCTDVAAFIADVAVQDDSSFLPGQLFVKTWRLENVGTCVWDRNYSLHFFGGDQMSAPSQLSLPATVNPGERVDLSVEMEAPQSGGAFQGYWRLRNQDGEYFGLGHQGRHSFWVKIRVVPTQTTNTPGE